MKNVFWSVVILVCNVIGILWGASLLIDGFSLIGAFIVSINLVSFLLNLHVVTSE